MHGPLRALQSTELALENGLRKDQIIISCKVSRPNDLLAIYRDLASKTDQPLHLGLTEAGMGAKGLVWSSAAMGILLGEGIGDTIRISLTPRPGGDRRDEVYAACELLQALGLRSFAPSVTACPGCGRTTSTTFQELAERIQGYVREKMPQWKVQYEGVEAMTLAVMGCIVNGPGESKAANIGISLPGTGEAPSCPVYIDGQKFVTLKGNYDELNEAFRKLIDDYVTTKYPKRDPAAARPESRSPSCRLEPPSHRLTHRQPNPPRKPMPNSALRPKTGKRGFWSADRHAISGRLQRQHAQVGDQLHHPGHGDSARAARPPLRAHHSAALLSSLPAFFDDRRLLRRPLQQTLGDHRHEILRNGRRAARRRGAGAAQLADRMCRGIF